MRKNLNLTGLRGENSENSNLIYILLHGWLWVFRPYHNFLQCVIFYCVAGTWNIYAARQQITQKNINISLLP